METTTSVEHKVQLDDYVKTDGLNQEILDAMLDYLLTLYNISETSRVLYLTKLRVLGLSIMKKGGKSFTSIKKADMDRFLSAFPNKNTLNTYITTLKPFYNWLNKGEVVKHLKFCGGEIRPITPSELLTPEEVIKLANEAGRMRREEYKVAILTLFESCAKISECLSLKLGDVVFSSVLDKGGHRKLIATLYFSRSKGNVPKQPVTLVMFASELKRWVDNHPVGESDSWLFPSPLDHSRPLSTDTIYYILYEAGGRLGIKKRLNPHFLRHSGLSFFANSKGYNEQLLMWRAGWKNTSMAKRYIHSGAGLEKRAYLQRMGYVIEEEKGDVKIVPKTCPHCNGINGATNRNCDFCGMPLDLEEYKAEIEKRRNMESLYSNLQKIYKGKLTREQKAELSKHTDIVKQLIEMGRDDLAAQFIEKLLESWVKVFLTA